MTERICTKCLIEFDLDIDRECLGDMCESNDHTAHVVSDPATVTDVDALVGRLRDMASHSDSDDISHQAEDSIMRAVLRSVARGDAADPAAMAQAALATRKIDFWRWYS